MNRFGEQPGRAVLLRQGCTITGTARVIGVQPSHLSQALRGRIKPNVRVRRQLPVLLGVPLDELFDEAMLKLPLEKRHLEDRLAS